MHFIFSTKSFYIPLEAWMCLAHYGFIPIFLLFFMLLVLGVKPLFGKVYTIKDGFDAEYAVNTSFEQVGYFLNEVSTTLRVCFDAFFKEDKQRLREIKTQNKRIQQIANIIIANIFKTLYLLNKGDVETTRKYSRTVGALQEITSCHRDIVMRSYTHVINCNTKANKH